MFGSSARKCCAWLLVGVLMFSSSSCAYNHHTNFGTTEKWVASEVNIVPKVLGSLLTSVVDSVFSPFTASFDALYYDEAYHPDHEYLSYSGSRAIGRSEMSGGYQAIASIFAIPIETVWLPLTGLVDLIYVLWIEDNGSGEG